MFSFNKNQAAMTTTRTTTTTAAIISGNLFCGCFPPEFPAYPSGFGTPVTLWLAGFFLLLDCPIRSFIVFSSLTCCIFSPRTAVRPVYFPNNMPPEAVFRACSGLLYHKIVRSWKIAERILMIPSYKFFLPLLYKITKEGAGTTVAAGVPVLFCLFSISPGQVFRSDSGQRPSD